MRTILAAALVVACAAGLSAKDAKKIDSKEGKFVATFPGDPKTLNPKAGGLDLHITVYEKDKDKKEATAYSVIYSDIPAEQVKAAKAEKLLETGEKGLVDTFKAKVTSSKEIKFGKQMLPAREIVAEKDDLTMRVTLVLAGNRLYQVFVVGPKDQVTGADANAFMVSFEITP